LDFFGGGSNFGGTYRYNGTSARFGGVHYIYIILKIWSHDLIGHFRGATWNPLIGPHGAQLLSHYFPVTYHIGMTSLHFCPSHTLPHGASRGSHVSVRIPRHLYGLPPQFPCYLTTSLYILPCHYMNFHVTLPCHCMDCMDYHVARSIGPWIDQNFQNWVTRGSLWCCHITMMMSSHQHDTCHLPYPSMCVVWMLTSFLWMMTSVVWMLTHPLLTGLG
jgi:hypothetical protein